MVGDFNQLSDTVLTQRAGLTQIVNQRTRGSNTLDRIFESSPIYTGVKVVTVRSTYMHVGYKHTPYICTTCIWSHQSLCYVNGSEFRL